MSYSMVDEDKLRELSLDVYHTLKLAKRVHVSIDDLGGTYDLESIHKRVNAQLALSGEYADADEISNLLMRTRKNPDFRDDERIWAPDGHKEKRRKRELMNSH